MGKRSRIRAFKEDKAMKNEQRYNCVENGALLILRARGRDLLHLLN